MTAAKNPSPRQREVVFERDGYRYVDDPALGRALRPARDAEGRDLLPTPVEKAESRIRELEEQLRMRPSS